MNSNLKNTATKCQTIFIAVVFIALCALTSSAQRRITPVKVPDPQAKPAAVTTPAQETTAQPLTDNDGNKLAPRPQSVVEQRDMDGRIVLVDTISGREYHDTILVVAPKLVYPRFHTLSIGVNVWDIAARALGQSYGLGSVWAELSLHNWIKPFAEIGLGSANYMPKDESYRYKSSSAPFFKLGANYNFLYNSNPNYSVYAGIRYGISSFSYNIEGATVNNGYWQESEQIAVPKQKATVGYGEALIGLRVQIVSSISLGWEIKWHKILHQGKHAYGEPWYIPGYGTRGNSFSGAFSISYTLPLHKTSPPVQKEPQ